MKIKLKEIIGQFLNSADQSSHEFLRLWNMGVWGMKTEFNLDITGTLKTTLLDVETNKTVRLPCDYISYSKIGVLNTKGEVVTFKRNDQLARVNKNASRLDNMPLSPSGYEKYINSPYYDNYFFNFYQNGSSFSLYGRNSGTAQIGSYTVDEDAGIIYLGLDNTYTSQIVLEYLSDGYSDSIDDYSVPVQASQAMLSYLRWKNSEDNKKYGRGEVVSLKSDYHNEKRLAKMRINKFVLNEMQDAIRTAQNLTAHS